MNEMFILQTAFKVKEINKCPERDGFSQPVH